MSTIDKNSNTLHVIGVALVAVGQLLNGTQPNETWVMLGLTIAGVVIASLEHLQR